MGNWKGGVDEFSANGGSGVFTESRSGPTGTQDGGFLKYFIVVIV